jgi:hypothetical protein
MRSSHPPVQGLACWAKVGIALAFLALQAPAQAAKPPAPAPENPDAVMVSDRLHKPAHKHRQVKPGRVQPKSYPTKPLPLIHSLRNQRSPS